MRRANDIERIYQLSSRRGNEERSVSAEQQPTCHLEGGTTERSVTTEQHGEEAVKNFTPRFGLTFIFLASTLPREFFAWSTTQNKTEYHAIVPKFRERGSDFLSNLNTSRSARHLKVGLKADQQSLGVSQTLKVSKQDYTSSATVRFHRVG